MKEKAKASEQQLERIGAILYRLNVLGEEMQVKDCEYTSIKEYISLYVQNHNSSQEFFNALCEHELLKKLLGAKGIDNMKILQSFHLLIANTTDLSDLIFIFSQPIVHQFLFQRFNIFKQNGQAVEYFVQLLKTIIMKLSQHGNASLIKLFCNNRFVTFPLLTVATILSTKLMSEVLVRVTAQQCVLLLLNLINTKGVGKAYLQEMQILVFYHEITSDIAEEEKDREGMLKYLVDLIFALVPNPISLSLLLNCLCNNLISKNLNHPNRIISFFIHFKQHMLEHFELKRITTDQIRYLLYNQSHILYRIIAKTYFDRFINSTYLTTYKLISNIKIGKQPNLAKLYQAHCTKVMQYLMDYDKKIDQGERQKMFAFQEWQHFNHNSKEVLLIKDDRLKQKSGFFNFFSKINHDTAEQYLKTALLTAGLKYPPLTPLYKLSLSVDFRTSLYLVEEIIFKYQKGQSSQGKKEDKYKSEKISISEIHLNDYFGTLPLDNQTLRSLLRLSELLSKQNVEYCEQQKIPSHLTGEYYFLYKLKLHLANTIHEYFNTNLSIKTILLIYSLFRTLFVGKSLQKRCKQKLFEHIEQLQTKIQQLIFEQGGIKYIVKYILNKKEEINFRNGFDYSEEEEKNDKKKIEDKIKQKQEGQRYTDKGDSPKLIKRVSKSKVSLEQNLIKYQTLKRMIDPELKCLYHYFEDKWKLNINKKQLLENFDKRYPIIDNLNKEIEIEISTGKKEGITIKIFNNGKVYRSFRYQQQQIKLSQSNPARLQFIKSGIEVLINRNQGESFLKQINRLRLELEETITMSVVQYLEMSYESLCVKVYHQSK